MSRLRVALVSREYPPDVYGGAGVHVEYLARHLRELVDLRVHCFGSRREDTHVSAHPSWDELSGTEPHDAALRTLSTDLHVAAHLAGAQIVHTHTWYANFAGIVGKLTHGARHVMTSHSLEPLRPWKAEQLGGGYALSCFVERQAIESADAVIAVSRGMQKDILGSYPEVDPGRVHVIENGIDPDEYRPDPKHPRPRAVRDRPRPSVRGVRRSHHPAKGRRPSARGCATLPQGRHIGSVRGRARHHRDRRGGESAESRSSKAQGTRCSGSTRCFRVPT